MPFGSVGLMKDGDLSPGEIDSRRAVASQDVYDKGDVSLPEGMRRLSDSEITELGLDPQRFQTSDGYAAALYYDEKAGSYVLANRGTEPTSFKDWMTNLTQGSGFKDAQYDHAITLAHDVSIATSRNVSFTGHSLGGGLASAQALATNLQATTFNAAGLSSGTIERYDLNIDSADRLITAYYVEGEVLSRIQDSTIADVAAGYYGTVPKNAIAAGRVISDVVTGQEPNYSSFGIGYVPEAVGRRIELPALTVEGQQMGVFNRLWNTVDLHGMEYVFRGLQYRGAN